VPGGVKSSPTSNLDLVAGNAENSELGQNTKERKSPPGLTALTLEKRPGSGAKESVRRGKTTKKNMELWEDPYWVPPYRRGGRGI